MTLAIMPGKVPFVRQKCIYISFRSMRSAVSANALLCRTASRLWRAMASWRLASRDAEKVYNDSLTVDLIIMDKFDANRRRLLALGGAALGAAAILPAPAFATLSTPRPRILTLNNLHTGESLKAEFFDGRGYIQDELARLNHFFRDSARIKLSPSIQICSIIFIGCRDCLAPTNLSSLFLVIVPSIPMMSFAHEAVVWQNTAITPRGRQWISILKVFR